MFILTAVKDRIRVDPSQFSTFTKDVIDRKTGKKLHPESKKKAITTTSTDHESTSSSSMPEIDTSVTKSFEQTIVDQIHKKYSNKVLPNVGFCIQVYKTDSIGDAYIYPNDGGTHSEVTFRLVVFRPLIHEVLVGRVASCDKVQGIRVHMYFFKDVYIPTHLLQPNTVFDEEEKLFVWKFQEYELYMDIDKEIRFRVQSIYFHLEEERGPPNVKKMALSMQQPTNEDTTSTTTAAVPTKPPMEIVARINEDGLGLVEWWT